jgi:hypothetical protein
MSKLTEQIFLSKWNKWEHEKVIEFGRKLYEANPNSDEWHWFNATYERQDVEWIRQLMKPKVEKKKGRWRAEVWEKYFYLTDSWYVTRYKELNHIVDNYLYSSGNYYQTQEDTEFARNKKAFITKVNDRIDELNDGWVADWNNRDGKYYIYNEKNWLRASYNVYSNDWTILKHMKSWEITETIISEFGDDLKKYIFTN